jgi:hypothetical protein
MPPTQSEKTNDLQFYLATGAQEMHSNSQFPESVPLHELRVSDKKTGGE